LSNFSSNFNNTSTFNNTATFNTKIYDDKYSYNDEDTSVSNKEVETKELWKKLKQLEHNLHINNISNKKSACFWCTCDFDSPPVKVYDKTGDEVDVMIVHSANKVTLSVNRTNLLLAKVVISS
jgi:hypothetical protein